MSARRIAEALARKASPSTSRAHARSKSSHARRLHVERRQRTGPEPAGLGERAVELLGERAVSVEIVEQPLAPRFLGAGPRLRWHLREREQFSERQLVREPCDDDARTARGSRHAPAQSSTSTRISRSSVLPRPLGNTCRTVKLDAPRVRLDEHGVDGRPRRERATVVRLAVQHHATALAART